MAVLSLLVTEEASVLLEGTLTALRSRGVGSELGKCLKPTRATPEISLDLTGIDVRTGTRLKQPRWAVTRELGLLSSLPPEGEADGICRDTGSRGPQRPPTRGEGFLFYLKKPTPGSCFLLLQLREYCRPHMLARCRPSRPGPGVDMPVEGWCPEEGPGVGQTPHSRLCPPPLSQGLPQEQGVSRLAWLRGPLVPLLLVMAVHSRHCPIVPRERDLSFPRSRRSTRQVLTLCRVVCGLGTDKPGPFHPQAVFFQERKESRALVQTHLSLGTRHCGRRERSSLPGPMSRGVALERR